MIVIDSEVMTDKLNTDSLNAYILQPNIETYRKSFKYADGKVSNDVSDNMQNVPYLIMSIRNLT